MPAKHGPNRFDSYIQVYETIMEQQLRGGFLLRNNLVFMALHDQILIEGSLDCRGDIYIDVKKTLQVIGEGGSQVMVQTRSYSYNVVLAGIGNIFRYDSPHRSHNTFHHVHRYDVLNGDRSGAVEPSHQEEWPHLQEVIEEAAEWYYANLGRLGSVRP